MITWTPKVCRRIAIYRFWAIILHTFGGLGVKVKGEEVPQKTDPQQGTTLEPLGSVVLWGVNFRMAESSDPL